MKAVKNFTFLFLFVISFSFCKKNIEKDVPKCIKSDVSVFEKTACKNSATCKEYLFQSKLVYVFNPGTCGADMTSEVKDSDCKTLGHLGGIAGNSTINGEDFSKAQYKRTVWKN